MASKAPTLNADQERIVDALMANLHIININSDHLSVQAKRDLTRKCIVTASAQAGADVVEFWLRNYTHPTLRARLLPVLDSVEGCEG